MARPAADRGLLPGRPAVPAARRLGASSRHRPPPGDRILRDGGLAPRPRHVARRRSPRSGRLRGRRRLSLARARLQQLRVGVLPAVAVPGGAARRPWRLAGGACRRLRSRVSRRRAGLWPSWAPRPRGSSRSRRGATALDTPAARSGPLAPPGGAGPRRPAHGGRRDSLLRIRRVLGPPHGRDERRGARAASRHVGPHRPRPSAVRRAPSPARGKAGGDTSRRSLSLRSSSCSRPAPARASRRAPRLLVALVGPRRLRPPPRARGARRTASRALGRGTREGGSISGALVRLHPALALAGLSGAGLDGWLHGRLLGWPKGGAPEDGAGASPSAAQRLAPAVLFGSAAAALLGAGVAAGRLTGLPAWTALLAAGFGAALLASVRAVGRPRPRLAGALLVAVVSASPARVRERFRAGAAHASVLRRGEPRRRPGPGVPGGLRSVSSRRARPGNGRSGVARRARGRARLSRATRTCRSASPRRPHRRRWGSPPHAPPRRGSLGRKRGDHPRSRGRPARRVSVSDVDPRRPGSRSETWASSCTSLFPGDGTGLLRAIGP